MRAIVAGVLAVAFSAGGDSGGRSPDMKKLLLTGVAALLLATGAAHAQQFIGGSGDYGRRHSYQGGSVRLTPSEVSCYRANYASTLAMQRCTDRAIVRLSAGSRRVRRR
jgi:hypothetical protein